MEEVVNDGQHLNQLIGICEGNDTFWLLSNGLEYYFLLLLGIAIIAA